MQNTVRSKYHENSSKGIVQVFASAEGSTSIDTINAYLDASEIVQVILLFRGDFRTFVNS